MPSVALPLSSDLVSGALRSTLNLISKNSQFLNPKQLSKKERRKKKKLERKLQRKYGPQTNGPTPGSILEKLPKLKSDGEEVHSESGGESGSGGEDFDSENWLSSNPPLEFETEGPQVSAFTLSLRQKYTCVNNSKKMNSCLTNGDAHPQHESPSKSTNNSTSTSSTATSSFTYGTVEEAPILKPNNNNKSVNGTSINGTNGHHKSDHKSDNGHHHEVNGQVTKSVPNGILVPKKLIQSNLTGFVKEKKHEEKVGVTLPEPKVVLYPRNKIKPGWRIKLPIGCGFINLGNTCYMNATLQALFHTPAFFNWLVDEVQSGEHKRKCERNSQSLHQCTLCPMTSTVLGAYNKTQAPMRPVMIHNKLKTIGKNFGYGRQEDAHEFLRLLLESMERSYLTAVGGNRLDNRSKETTPLGQIFGGYTRGEVRCLTCRHVSTTFHPLAELQLDIREVNNVEDALGFYFQKERLNNNDYKCERCKTVQPATKQQFMELAPIVLCIQLKRFRACGSKIKKPIFVNERLNLRRFMYNQSQDNDRPQASEYKLVGLVTHMGPSPNCGHYTAIAQASNGNFYHFDDSYVRMTNLNYAQNADAYVIIYEMVDRNNRPVASSSSASSTSTAPRTPSATTTSSTSISTSPKTATAATATTKFIGPQLPPGGLKSNPSPSPAKPSMPSSSNNNNVAPKSPIVKSITGSSSPLIKKSAGNVVNGIGVKTSFTINRSGGTLGPSAKIFQKNSNQQQVAGKSPLKNGGVTKLVAYGDSDDEDSGQGSPKMSQGAEGTNGGEAKKSYRPPSPPKIKSWSNDEESKLGKVMELERKRPFAKTKEELEDEEIDAGRQKKKAKSHSPELSRQQSSSSSQENPFNKHSSS